MIRAPLSAGGTTLSVPDPDFASPSVPEEDLASANQRRYELWFKNDKGGPIDVFLCSVN